MITVINKANKGLYNQLFQDVQEWLYTHNNEGEVVEKYGDGALLGQVPEVRRNPETGEETQTGNMVPETLTSLEELFMFMRQITRFAPIYTRLPLDEEPFFIDADSRTITVPKDFAINGVSVQGDEVAEILFFKINRFFDATDLSQCKIFIQWKSAEADEFGNLTEGVSRPWITDIESEPGYLIFGWPISSKITKKPGNVTFSIRFYRLDQADKLLYSFSTLDQTVKIQPALDYDIEDIVNDTSDIVIDDMTSDIVNRAISSPASSGATVAEKPVWEDGILQALYSRCYATEYKADGSVKYRLMNLGVNGQGFSNMDVVLRIAALSGDSGVVSYTWTKVNKDGVGDLYLTDEVTPFYKAVDYIPDETTEANRESRKTYYWKDGDRYKPIPNHTSLDDVRDEHGTVYSLVSTAILDEVGKYVAMAENRVGKSFSEALIADAIYVPLPVAPELGTLETQGAGSAPILDTDAVTLGLDVVLKDEFGHDVGVNDLGGKATYVWHHRGLGDATATDLSDTGAQLILTPSDNPEEVTALEGYYSVTVTNNLNKETIDSESNEIRITKPAVKLEVSINESDHINILDIDPTVGLEVFVSGQEPNRVEENVEDPDTITYQWYRWAALSGKDATVDRRHASEGTYVINGDIPVDLLAMGDSLTQEMKDSAHTAHLIPPGDGYYFCKVTNHYNGTDTETLSPFYNVVD